MKYKFIGWCKEGIHDKVWGAISLREEINSGRYQASVLTFWGRRGKKLQTKLVLDDWDLSKLITSKEKKGYKEINESDLDQVYPEFQNDLEKTAIWATLKF